MKRALQKMTRPFGKYELHRRIAIGGMAEIFLAQVAGVEGFAKPVVVKRMLPDLAEDPDFVRMFVDEAKLAATLTHPAIVQVYELGVVGGRYFIAMEYVAGLDLSTLIRRLHTNGESIPPGAALAIAEAALHALHYAHEKKDSGGVPLELVHRDVSPQNILVSDEGLVKLTDFGIAKARTRSSKTRTGTLKGKLAYMAPEQAMGAPVDRRSDTFALALVLYELLAGERPYRALDDGEALALAQGAAITPLAERIPGFPKELSQVMETALAKDPAQRFATAEDFAQALRTHGPALAHPFSARELSAMLARAMATSEAPEDDDLDGELDGAPRSGTQVKGAGTGVRAASEPPPRARRVVPVIAAVVLTVGAIAFWETRPPPVAPVIDAPAPASVPIVVVVPVAPPPRAPVVSEPGSLTLNSVPWSYVWIDGKKQSKSTPLLNLALPAGRHHIKLHSPGAQRETELTIDIAAGRNTTKIVNFTR